MCILQEGLVKVERHWLPEDWEMTFNLKFICENTGVKKKEVWEGKAYYTQILSKTETKRIFKFIKRYGEDDAIVESEKYVLEHGNEKAKQAWREA